MGPAALDPLELLSTATDDERVGRVDPLRCKAFWLFLAVTWLITAGAFSPTETAAGLVVVELTLLR